MGYAEDNAADADSLELGSMPPLPRPRAHPAARSPLSVVSGSSTSGATRKSTPRDRFDDTLEEEVVTVSPPPVPHAHPLRGWKPRARQTTQGRQSAPGEGGGGGAAMMEHMRRPLRSRQVDVERLHPTMLSRARVAALATNKENALPSDPHGLEIVPHSTRALAKRIDEIAAAPLEPLPLSEDALRFAATEASELRQLGYDGMDPRNRRLIAAQPTQPDSALERARVRKVKKQVDARWLEKRTDPALRPLGPLEREDERAFYDSVYVADMQELLDEGVLFDEQDRKSALAVQRIEYDDLARDTRGTTGLSGSCFDEWSFQ